MIKKWVLFNRLPLLAGRFWLYGKLWDSDTDEIYIIESMQVSNGFMHSCKSSFIFDTDFKEDFYISRLSDPELPNETNVVSE